MEAVCGYFEAMVETRSRFRPHHSSSDCSCCMSARGHDTVMLSVIAVTAVGCSVGAAWAFSNVAPEPYMAPSSRTRGALCTSSDEIFHVPQSQAYCRGEYGRWDPKITTPPGLYVFAMAYARLVAVAQAIVLGGAVSQDCKAVVLRQINWLFSLGTLGVMRGLVRRRMGSRKALAHAILLWLFPVSFFFSFLLYTDPGATFFILLCYFLATGPRRGGGWGRRCGSALAGCVAILFRQTNAVWVAFTLAVCLLEDFMPLVDGKRKTKSATDDKASPPAAAAAASSGADGFDVPTALRKSGEYSRKSPSFDNVLSSTRKRRRTATTARQEQEKEQEQEQEQSTRSAGKRGAGGPSKEGADCREIPEDSGSDRLSEEDREEERRRRSIVPNDRVGRGRREGGGQRDAAAAAAATGGCISGCSSRPLSPVRLLVRLARAAAVDASRGGPLLRLRLPLAIPVVLFAVFVWGFNGGAVVIGDKDNHSPGGPPHLAQLAYLVAVGSSLWGLVGKEAVFGEAARREFLRWAGRRGPMAVVAIVGAVALVLWRYSLEHPFLLSDNRHYPFYVWQRLLSRSVVRCALAPAYLFCGWLMAARLLERKPSLWVLAYAGATAVVLVPSPLLEPRYVTIPVLLAHLESRERTWGSLVVGVALCAAVNAGTIYVFLARPFTWHDGSVARFMW